MELWELSISVCWQIHTHARVSETVRYNERCAPSSHCNIGEHFCYALYLSRSPDKIVSIWFCTPAMPVTTVLISTHESDVHIASCYNFSYHQSHLRLLHSKWLCVLIQACSRGLGGVSSKHTVAYAFITFDELFPAGFFGAIGRVRGWYTRVNCQSVRITTWKEAIRA